MSVSRGIGALVLVPIVGAALAAGIPPQTALVACTPRITTGRAVPPHRVSVRVGDPGVVAAGKPASKAGCDWYYFSRGTQLEVDELARYRLTTAVFLRFEVASRSIATATRADPAFARDPLFTREIMLSGDAAMAATALETRLQAHPALVVALRAGKLSARDYTKFALTMFAARLVHEFVKTGVIRRVPDGAAAANVAFVQAHEAEIASLLADLGIDG
jgi:hypothetical protein